MERPKPAAKVNAVFTFLLPTPQDFPYLRGYFTKGHLEVPSPHSAIRFGTLVSKHPRHLPPGPQLQQFIGRLVHIRGVLGGKVTKYRLMFLLDRRPSEVTTTIADLVTAIADLFGGKDKLDYKLCRQNPEYSYTISM